MMRPTGSSTMLGSHCYRFRCATLSFKEALGFLHSCFSLAPWSHIPAGGALHLSTPWSSPWPGLVRRGRPVLHQLACTPVDKMPTEQGRSPDQKVFPRVFRVSAKNVGFLFFSLSLSLLPLVVKAVPSPAASNVPKTTPPAPSRDLERSAAWEEPQHSAKCQSSVFIFSPPSDSTLVLQVLDGEMKKTDLFI